MYTLKSILGIGTEEQVIRAYEESLMLQVIGEAKHGLGSDRALALAIQTDICGEAVMLGAYRRGLTDHRTPTIE